MISGTWISGRLSLAQSLPVLRPEKDTLGSSCRHAAGGVVVAIEELERDGDELTLERRDAGIFRWPEGVGLGKLQVSILGDLPDLIVNMEGVHESALMPLLMPQVPVGPTRLLQHLPDRLPPQPHLTKLVRHPTHPPLIAVLHPDG